MPPAPRLRPAAHPRRTEVAGFLRRLHAVDVPHELPVDPNGRADMAWRVPRTREQLARMLALSLCAALAAYGHEEGMTNVEREAIDGLERAAADVT